MKALATTALWLLAVSAMTFALWAWLAQRDLGSALDLQRARVAELRGMVEHVRAQRVVRDPDGLGTRLATAERRLGDVCEVLQVLIRTEQATGRRRWNLERLPGDIAAWCEVPCRGEHIGSITEKKHPCDQEGAAR